MNLNEIEAINRKVNAYPFENETKENWERISIKGAGDCDSFAMEKYMLLREAGFPVEDMCIATCHTETGVYHAVLLVKLDDEIYVLDNRSKWVKTLAQTRAGNYDYNYIPEYMEAS